MATNRKCTATWVAWSLFCFSWWHVYKAHLGLFRRQICFLTLALYLVSSGLRHVHLTIPFSVNGVLIVPTSRVAMALTWLTRDFLCFLQKV